MSKKKEDGELPDREKQPNYVDITPPKKSPVNKAERDRIEKLFKDLSQKSQK